jgi:hypothetical protein
MQNGKHEIAIIINGYMGGNLVLQTLKSTIFGVGYNCWFSHGSDKKYLCSPLKRSAAGIKDGKCVRHYK